MASDLATIEETPAQRRKRRALKLVMNFLFAAMAYVLVVLGARMLHRRVLYQPPEGPAASEVPEGATRLTARAADGVAVNALEFVAPKATRTIVHFHGNAETAEDNAALARDFKRRGFSVVLAEYRGYGRSKGAPPTEEGLYLDASAILDALAARGVGPDRVVLWGQSLGTGVATEMAKRGRGSRLVLVAPFTSTYELGKRVMPVLPMSYVMVDRFDSLAKAPSITIPALVVHGDTDDVIPMEFGKRLSEAFPHATFLEIPEGRHDNLYKSASAIAAIANHVNAP